MALQHWQIVNNNRTVVSNTPEMLWSNAVQYFQWCDDNPLETKITVTTGKEAGNHVKKIQPRPYSVKALCLHCNVLEEYIRDLRASGTNAGEWYHVVSKILYIIYTQNLEYAITDTFNPIMISKVLNMEKDDVPSGGVTVKIITQDPYTGNRIPELSSTENDILKKLELEISLAQKSKEQ